MGLKPIKGNYEAAKFAASVLFENSCESAIRFARELSHEYRTWDSIWQERYCHARMKKYGRPRRTIVKKAMDD
ncbi:MAG: hypothetical protein IJ180_08240 [Bacteroidales bacterium]|nr:hypothetical protein [Bacteroidales bacterium]